MNARMEKKLSLRLLEIAPHLFIGAWKCKEPSEMAERENSMICGCLHIGGGLDYWGDANESYSLLEYFRDNWMWFGDFKPYPKGNEFEHFPDTGSFRPTTVNLINLAKRIEERHQAKLKAKHEQALSKESE